MLQLGSGEVEIKRIVEWNLSDDRDERGNPRNGTEEERRTALIERLNNLKGGKEE